ncbi:TAXI family TRAP transporter solute-binding subunit [Guptibacillus hwajinpoensis]|uniref:TAXI family TRAP transporter solute-binding subunit n=1 Tax=Guptibacillus hwajinpoensis TaxID=208199 RepID=UPI001CD44CD6|nr:TAXI family TRAP transporter solute-binding subunit [Pseudalkalibacillus hwajinpoensis]MCA0990543.1 TAXI family TRAP transporter solute-binding subunit [Pseudalkalibacillus hwajinpoensis]
MRKSLISLLIALTLIVMTACGNSASSDGEGLEAPDKFLKVGSGPMGSGWYPITTALSELYMDHFSGLNVSQIEGGSTSNLKSLQIGDIQYGIHYTSDFADAVKGTGSFDEQLDQVAGLTSLYPVYQTIATLADNEEINKVEDIVDQHIFLGPKGGGGPVAFWRMMKEYGIDEGSIEDAGGKISYGNYSDGASMLKDGIVDVFVGGGAPQVTSLQEIEVTKPVKVIPIDEEKLKAISDKGLGISNDNLPGGTYKGLEEEIPTYTLVAMFSVRSDLPEDYVYNLTKVFWENQDPFKEQIPQRAKNFTLETALDGIDPETLHPGAKKYYEEEGIIQ